MLGPDDIFLLRSTLAKHGLMVRGGFAAGHADALPAGPSGAAARSVMLVGHGGAGYWVHFQNWLARQDRKPEHPLDTWTRSVIDAAAGEVGARAVYPSDQPYLPFQQWAMRAEGLKPSPLGILMHPDFGLWHAYRGALLFDQVIESRPAWPASHLCDECRDRPCLAACPVDAYDGGGFAYDRCRAHVASNAGETCRSGCLDRNACPEARTYRYPKAVQAFHMAAFTAADASSPPGAPRPAMPAKSAR